MPQRAVVRIQKMPLGEALDKLTEIYPETEWEWRKFGFIVIRGPRNQIRRGSLIKQLKPAAPSTAPLPGDGIRNP